MDAYWMSKETDNLKDQILIRAVDSIGVIATIDERTKNTHELVKGMREDVDKNTEDIALLKNGKPSWKKRIENMSFGDVMKICAVIVIGISTIIGAVVAT
jgi:hypothetical protein